MEQSLRVQVWSMIRVTGPVQSVGLAVSCAHSAWEAIMHAHMLFLLSMASAGSHGHLGDNQTLSSGDNSIQKS